MFLILVNINVLTCNSKSHPSSSNASCHWETYCCYSKSCRRCSKTSHKNLGRGLGDRLGERQGKRQGGEKNTASENRECYKAL